MAIRWREAELARDVENPVKIAAYGGTGLLRNLIFRIRHCNSWDYHKEGLLKTPSYPIDLQGRAGDAELLRGCEGRAETYMVTGALL